MLSALAPGLEAADVAAGLSAVGLAAPPPLISLYRWHDGVGNTQGVIGDLCLMPGFFMLPLAESLQIRHAFLTDPRWDQTWLPLFADGGGDYLVIELRGDGASPIRHFESDGDSPVLYATLDDLLETAASAYESSVYYVDHDGYLEMNDLEFVRLARSLNPGVPYWRMEQ